MKINIVINLFAIHSYSCLKICVALALSFSFLQACSNDDEKMKKADTEEVFSGISMEFKNLSPDLIDNSHLYVFDGSGNYQYEKMNITKTSTKLTTSMPVGTWGLVLLSSDMDITNQIILPDLPYDGTMKNSVMWKTPLVASDNEFLSQTPADLRYSFLDNIQITEGVTTNANTIFTRNVAKIEVILDEYSGFDNITSATNPYAYVELMDVPSTLTWEGKYYPSKEAPAIAEKPIREYFQFKKTSDNGKMKADTVVFIIPAHRGTDALDEFPKDTTSHKLRLRASMPQKNESYFGKTPFEISFSPKLNQIIQIRLKFRGAPATDLDVKVNVKPWEDPIDQEVIFD